MLLLSGCGQMGPLYEPEDTPPTATTSAPAA
jgi:predicted small lipoprotein YifL